MNDNIGSEVAGRYFNLSPGDKRVLDRRMRKCSQFWVVADNDRPDSSETIIRFLSIVNSSTSDNSIGSAIKPFVHSGLIKEARLKSLFSTNNKSFFLRTLFSILRIIKASNKKGIDINYNNLYKTLCCTGSKKGLSMTQKIIIKNIYKKEEK